MSSQLEWHGDEAKRHVRARAVRVLHRAAIAVKNRAKELLSVAGSREEGRGRFFMAKKVKGKLVLYFHSLPGDPPRKQTGRLRASVAHEVDDASLTARVGTNVEYGRHLELGTKKGLRPRPWLRRALAETAGRVQSLLAGLGE